LRELLLRGAPAAPVGLPTDFAVLAIALGALVLISARIYPNIAH
jgi:hypothetical protein